MKTSQQTETLQETDEDDKTDPHKKHPCHPSHCKGCEIIEKDERDNEREVSEKDEKDEGDEEDKREKRDEKDEKGIIHINTETQNQFSLPFGQQEDVCDYCGFYQSEKGWCWYHEEQRRPDADICGDYVGSKKDSNPPDTRNTMENSAGATRACSG